MNTSTDRVFRTSIIAMLAGFLLFLAEPTTVMAQQTNQEKSLKEHIQKKQEELRQKAGIEEDQQLQRPQSGIDLGSLAGPYAVFEKDQSWMFGNPGGSFKTPPYQSGQWAGDINNDGLADLVMRSRPNGPESIVYFGGNTSVIPDQIFNRWLSPIGDVNDDGYTDAVTRDGIIFLGGDNGYQNSGISIPQTGFTNGDFGGSSSFVIPAGDLNGDGIDDVILTRSSSYFTGPRLMVFWGDDSGNALQNYRTYEVNAPTYDRDVRNFVANTGNFDADSQNEIYVFGFDEASGSSFIRILDLDANNDIQLAQDFDFTQSLVGNFEPSEYAINVLDINSDGFSEIFLRPQNRFWSAPNYVYTEDGTTEGVYGSEPVNVYDGIAWPVGDLNGDGRIDFHVDDGEAHIAYGPDVISDGLSNNFELNLTSNNQSYRFTTEYPYLNLGDVNDDQVADYVLGFNDYANNQLGRAFIYGNDSGDPTTDTKLTDKSEFIDSFTGTANIGDVNGDGIDDFAINRTTTNTIEVFYGGESMNDQPDLTIDALYEYTGTDGNTYTTSAISIVGGDFNDDGFSDIAVGTNVGHSLNIYFGGESMDAEVDHQIVGEDFKQDGGSISTFYFVHNIGDVNDDGVDDLLMGSLLGGHDVGYYNEAYVLFGGNTLSDEPDQIIQLSEAGPSTYAGYRATSIGDMNGDGIDDFAVSSPFYDSNNNNRGKVDVFYGNSSGDFTSPDMTLFPSGNDDTYGFGYSLAGGDFNADEAGDVAVGKQIVYPASTSDEEVSNIDVFLGGDHVDDEVDHHLKIDSESVGMSGNYLQRYTGRLSTIDDHDGNGTDEIIAFSPGAVNAVVFSGDLNITDQQTLVLKSHNASASLGNLYNNAVGDFTGNGNPDIIAQQSSRESSFIDVGHRYGLPDPINIASVEDVPNDQGGWVRVQTDGYYIDALDADIVGFDHWAVWRQNDDGNWVNVGTVPAYGESADYVDVHVPNTKIEGSEADSTTYNFKVTAQNTEENNLAVSDVESGFALDNIAPDAVTGVTTERSNNEVIVSWNASSANDLNQYEIVTDGNPEETLVTTYQNSATLSDSEFSGVQNISVRARDIHENVGAKSERELTVFEMEFDYAVEDRWNLIGVPLDADEEEISSLLSNIEGNKLYRYDGSYEQVDEVESGHGYWAKYSSSESYGITGLPLTELTIELDKGWNLISGAGASLSFDQIQDQDDILIEGTLRGFNGAYQEETTMQPVDGYWIRASEAGNITLALGESSSETNQAKENKPVLAEVKDELSKVKVTSSEGYNSTLYFGDELPEKVNPLSFSMPPVAPGETFDVRFGNNSMNYVEGNEFILNIEKQDRASDITIELALSVTNKHQSFKVQEIKGTEVLAEYTVGDEKLVTLKNNDVTSVTFTPAGTDNLARQDTPDKFELAPSYPNPFNPSTTIKYQLPEQVAVNVDVYNMAGKKVRTLVAGEQQDAGTHTVRFNASNLASGVYFVQMRAGSFEKIQKITLIK